MQPDFSLTKTRSFILPEIYHKELTESAELTEERRKRGKNRQYEGPPKIDYRGLAAESSIPHILREAKDDKEKRDK